jgi:hypothetical protein
MTGETTAMEIDASGRVSTGGDGELDWGARERRGELGSSVWVKGGRGRPWGA